MTPQLIIAAVIAAAGFGAGWQIQSWRYGAKEKEHAEQKLVEVRQSAAAAIRRADSVIAAQSASSIRAAGLRRDLDSARSELARLRIAIRDSVPATDATTAACPDRTDTVRELFAACATELQSVAGAADRHASDALMLREAWPK